MREIYSEEVENIFSKDQYSHVITMPASGINIRRALLPNEIIQELKKYPQREKRKVVSCAHYL